MTGNEHSDLRRSDIGADDAACHVRTYAREDADEVQRLVHHGLLPGYVEYDFCDLDRIESVYLNSQRGHFWVVEVGGNVVGTLALAESNCDVAQLRWLRVAPAWQAGHHVARQLLLAAVDHAREMGFLKLVLHAPPHVQPLVVSFFRLLGFAFSRAKTIAGRNMLEFYLNLYERPKPQSDDGADF